MGRSGREGQSASWNVRCCETRLPACTTSRDALHRRVSNWWQTALGRLRVLGFLEGVSFVLLLAVAMPLKYLANSPGAVSVVGMAHGILFVLYLLAAVHAAVEYDWPWRRVAWLALAACLPLGPFVADVRLLRDVRP